MASLEVEARAELIRKIKDGSITTKQVQKEIDALEKQYGEYVFFETEFESKEKPWTSDYYDELKLLAMSGDGSKKLILHMAEVGEYLRNKKGKKILLLVGTGIILLIVVLTSIILYAKYKSNVQQQSVAYDLPCFFCPKERGI